jgi:hypothetical protein
MGGWIGSKAGLDAVVETKILSPLRESNPPNPIVQSVAQRYAIELSRLLYKIYRRRTFWFVFYLK